MDLRVLCLLMLATFAFAFAQPNSETIVKASDGVPFDEFGKSTAIHESFAIVGASHWDGEDQENVGAAYLYESTGENWVEITQLLSEDGDAGDQFGNSVDIHGSYAVIGAWFDEGFGTNAGSAYVFERNENGQWIQMAKLTSDDLIKQGDHFGFSVAIHETRVVVGAYFDEEMGENAGAAYVFELQDGTWIQTAKLMAADGADGDQFGCAVSVSGNQVVIGARTDDYDGLDNAGSAYIFEFDDQDWIQVVKLLAVGESGGDHFGNDVSIDQGRAIIGHYQDDNAGSQAGTAHIFQRDETTGEWTLAATLLGEDTAPFDEFGYGVSIKGDVAVVGARFDDDAGDKSGSAYLFRQIGDEWIQVYKVVASDSRAESEFGGSVGLQGTKLIVGARLGNEPKTGAAYIYDIDEATGIDPTPVRPASFQLLQNYPNPFNPSTTIGYELARSTRITISIFNLLGQEVITLVDAVQPAGIHEVSWDGKGSNGRAAPAGIYFYQMRADAFLSTRKMMLVE